MADRRDRDRALLREGRTTKATALGRCYFCGRVLVSAAPLNPQKAAALYANMLTCGPCVHVHGRPRWQPACRGPMTDHQRRRLKVKLELRERRACEHCGGEYTARQPHQKFCSGRCYEQARGERRRRARAAAA